MTETISEGKQAASRSKGRMVWHGVRVSFLLLMLPVIFAVIAALMMIDRDITAPTWIVSRIEARAADMLGGGSLAFGDIKVNIGHDLHPRVRLIDTSIRDADGKTIARVSELSGLMSPRGLLFKRAALMQEVTLWGAHVSLRRARDGTVAVAFDRSGTEVDAAPSLPLLLDQLDEVFERPALEALEQVHIAGLVVNYGDARAGRNWTVDGGEVTLDLRGAQTQVRGAFALLSGGAQVTTLSVNFATTRGERAAEFGVSIENARARDIATQSAALSWLAAIDAPISAQLRTRIDDAGALGPLSAALQIGEGALQPTAEAAPLRFAAGRAYLTFDPQTQRIAFDEVSVESDWGRLRAQGQAFARELQNGLPQALIGQFTLSEIALNPAGIYPDPMQIENVIVDARLRLDPFSVELGQAVITDPSLPLHARGRIAATRDGWNTALDLQGGRMSVASLMALWPESMLPGTRVWFDENLLDGQMDDLTVAVRARANEGARVGVSFAFSDASVRFLKRMPPVTGGAGFANVTDNTFALTLDRGEVLAPQGGKLDIAGSTLVIPDVRARPRQMEIALTAQSSVTAALAVLDLPPLGVITKAGLPVTVADGFALTEGTLAFPLKRRIAPDEVRYDMAAVVRRVRSDQLVPDRTLAASRMRVEVDNSGVTVSGPMTLDGVPVDGSFRRPFNVAADGPPQVTARVELSQRALDAFDIALPPGTVGGAGEGALTLTLPPGASPQFDLTSNLRGVTLALPAIGWSKPASEAGLLRISGQLGAARRIDRLEVSGGGLSATGRINFDDAGRFTAARFSQVRLGNWLNAPITLRGRGAGRAVGVDIAGGTLDLRRARFGPGGQDGGPVNIVLDRLQITQGIALTDFRGDFDGTGGFSGQFSGRVNGGPALAGTVVPQNGRSAVRLRSDDAGGVVAAAGFLRNGVGGTLDLTLLPVATAGTFDGALAIRGLRVRDAPAMAALLDAISVVGLLQQLDGQGLSFEEVDARFRLTPNQVIVTQASAVGPGLGISLDGIYTLASKTLEFQGVISPFYLINSIGSVLTRRGEGLIGFNFTVEGTSDAPQVSVNPLSAFTPGMFREIFRRAPPQVSQ